MSRRWTAKVFVNSNVGEIPVEVYASTYEGARQQIYAKHGDVQHISNLYEQSEKSGGGSGLDIGSTGALVILGGGLLAFFTITPWIMAGVGGAAGTWIGEKVTGYSIEEYTETKNTTESDNKKALSIFLAAILLGGIGFAWGDNFKKGFDAEYNTSSVIENIRKG